MEPVQPVQMKMREGFEDERRIQDREQVKNQQTFVFVAYLTIPSSNWEHVPRHDNSIPCVAVW